MTSRTEIDKCGKNGGLIIVTKMPDKARIEAMQAMLQSIIQSDTNECSYGSKARRAERQ
jgi:hypothetical protein